MPVQPKARWAESSVEPSGIVTRQSVAVRIAPLPPAELSQLIEAIKAISGLGAVELKGELLSFTLAEDADVDDIRRAVDAALDHYPAEVEQREHEAAARAARSKELRDHAADVAREMQERFRARLQL
jgi:hypothetical protein